jgi:hypothetical protein
MMRISAIWSLKAGFSRDIMDMILWRDVKEFVSAAGAVHHLEKRYPHGVSFGHSA